MKEYIRDTKQFEAHVCFLIYVGIILGLKIILKNKPSMIRHACNTVRRGLRQEDHEVKAFLGHMEIPILL